MWGTTKKRVYLDWAAAAMVSQEAQEAFLRALPHFGNPGALHAEAVAAKALLEEARTTIARLAEVKTDGVIFTSGATEANALALLGLVRAHGASGAHVLYDASQHASVVGTLRMLEAEGALLEEIDFTKIEKQIRPETVLVTVDVVNSETGAITNTREVRRALDRARPGILLHVDASQAPYTQNFALSHLGADLVTLDAQKVGGVRGIGTLLIRQGIALAPLMGGGGQERGRRPGTENPALAQAFATALLHATQAREAFTIRAASMRTALVAHLRSLPTCEINEGEENVPHIVNLSLRGRDTDYAVLLLDKEGFAVSTKSACETDEEGSRVVRALTGDEARATSTLRISWGPTTTEREIESFKDALTRTVRFLDENAIY